MTAPHTERCVSASAVFWDGIASSSFTERVVVSARMFHTATVMNVNGPHRYYADPFAASPMEKSSKAPGTHGVHATMSKPPGEVDWNALDKSKFFFGGAALFSGVTCCLYPLSVIKTRQMVDGGGAGTHAPGALKVVKQVIKQRGFLGLYQGFGTVVVGTLPIRFVYLSTLELVKARVRDLLETFQVHPMYHGLADAAGGAVASSFSQILGVPIDVISQRQMVQGVSVTGKDGKVTQMKGYKNGYQALTQIVKKDGVKGLYRGFGASVATLVPGSALWWGFYGTYQRVIWSVVPETWHDGSDKSDFDKQSATKKPAESKLIFVQIASGVCAGMTSGFLTTPLDIVKTRLQVLSGQPGGESRPFSSTARALYAEHGAKGFLRGVKPRMTSVSIWGTTMVTAYEFLKRLASADAK